MKGIIVEQCDSAFIEEIVLKLKRHSPKFKWIVEKLKSGDGNLRNSNITKEDMKYADIILGLSGNRVSITNVLSL